MGPLRAMGDPGSHFWGISVGLSMMLMLSLVFGTSNSRRDDLGSDLSGSLPGQSDLGYAGGRTPAQAAYAAGSGWVDLNRVAQDDPTQGDLVTSAESLRRAMYQLEADGGDSSRDLDAFFSRLESADLPMASSQATGPGSGHAGDRPLSRTRRSGMGDLVRPG